MSPTAGTLAYMAPEQLRGRGIGPATDIYAFACLICEMLTGDPPFVTGDLRWQIMHEEPEFSPELSAPMKDVLLSALAKDPARRPATAGALVAGLSGKAVASKPEPKTPAAATGGASDSPSDKDKAKAGDTDDKSAATTKSDHDYENDHDPDKTVLDHEPVSDDFATPPTETGRKTATASRTPPEAAPGKKGGGKKWLWLILLLLLAGSVAAVLLSSGTRNSSSSQPDTFAMEPMRFRYDEAKKALIEQDGLTPEQADLKIAKYLSDKAGFDAELALQDGATPRQIIDFLLRGGQPDATKGYFDTAVSSLTKNPRAGDTWREPVTGMEFVYVKGSCFQMGSNDGDDDEKPVHRVCIDGFWIGKYEVTQGQWQKIMGSNPSRFKKGSNYPVEQVSWNDCQDFIKKLNRKSGKTFRLPTEAEWEYACRSGGREDKYSGGSDVDRVAWYSGNSGGFTHAVGGKAGNGLGIYDMSGNVWEWCSDWYDENYYGNSPTQNPQGPGSGSLRVYRGGSWHIRPARVRAAFRDGLGAAFRYDYLGFRLAFSSAQQVSSGAYDLLTQRNSFPDFLVKKRFWEKMVYRFGVGSRLPEARAKILMRGAEKPEEEKELMESFNSVDFAKVKPPGFDFACR